ncbi:DUF1501 domain-containing protein [Solilutibacter silvestris]|uniref:DUF1501 domain-containing protein n=1 Tax=Solilutibacter silvestris TaxID=1645665 RepID=A0A2K1Q0M3_9GAMM|nr:DUF1501 domain-containing protein [Lysobacter silvestris]PNS08591.1 hypothetical protein Lysil_0220 [Lysobacter silvestris]
MERRDVLKLLALASAASCTSQLFAAPAAPGKFLLVFLRGGYDAANLLVPHASDFYYTARPTIAVAKDAALPLDASWSLHPALRAHVHPMFQSGQAAFIPFAGVDDLTRSHFETQDSIELGQPVGNSRDFSSGFMNRLAGVLHGGGAVSFTDQLPLTFRGGAQVPNVNLLNLSKSGLDAQQTAVVGRMYAGSPLATAIRQGAEVRKDVMMELSEEMTAANRNAASAKGFAQEAQRIARLMRDKYNLGFVDVGGWDTHVGQGAATGYLANRFDELGQGLQAFAQELGPQWRNTVVLVLSEFGRTFRENGDKGTDHGHGSVYWVLGGALHGGRVAGEQVVVSQPNLFQNRDYPVLNDYRAILGGLFHRMYGLSAAQLGSVFPGAKPVDLGLV